MLAVGVLLASNILAGSTPARISRAKFASLRHASHTRGCRSLRRVGVEAESHKSQGVSRREAMTGIPAAVGAFGLGSVMKPDTARAAMIMFPPESLNNRYFLLRAGEDQLLARDTIITNKVYTNSFEHGLTSTGKRQVVAAYENLRSMLKRTQSDSDDIVLWPSIQYNAYQSATILSELLGLGQNRVVPEYTFLDPRGMGTFEEGPLTKYDFVHKRDREQGVLYAPPRNVDGTDNESVNDVFIRVRQALSITETQYSGRTVVFIAPDSDCLSILEAAMRSPSEAGFLNSLANHARFAYAPGEVREVGIGPLPSEMDPDSETKPKRKVTEDDVRATLGVESAS
eukprot:CAMPEP_0170186944 /NCGR_PEP_ID=MMETSP0040_2-20121228/40515_1 /TAXON_ID=641309 /ORGANISM="Lotharella oceanica, Strain CCMP622" /LENGTH=341 /DNA_ID=CAMNT_0010433831 /DNA_START=11 /DNA_END=1036 /DNA_ORIENTATION=+